MTDRKHLKKHEIIILFAAVAVSAAVLIFPALFSALSPKPETATITLRGESFTVSLSEDKIFTLSEIAGESDSNLPQMTFEVKNGGIAVLSSDCPDGDCVKAGFITHSGSAAVCVPNKVTVSLSGTEKTFDAVV
jgi:hypothetical protein